MHQGPGSRLGEGGVLVSMVTWNGLCFPGSAFGPGQWTEGLGDGDRAGGWGEQDRRFGEVERGRWVSIQGGHGVRGEMRLGDPGTEPQGEEQGFEN